MDGEAWQATVHGLTKSRTRLSDFTFTFTMVNKEQVWINFDTSLQKNIKFLKNENRPICGIQDISWEKGNSEK